MADDPQQTETEVQPQPQAIQSALDEFITQTPGAAERKEVPVIDAQDALSWHNANRFRWYDTVKKHGG